MLTLPTLTELQDILTSIRNEIRASGYSSIDVRLVVGSPDSSHDGHWEVMTGDVSYDLWHGICADDVVCADDTRVGCLETARNMLESIRDQWEWDAD